MATAALLADHGMGLGHQGKDTEMRCASMPDSSVGTSSSGSGPRGPRVEHSPSPDCPPGRHTSPGSSSASPTSTCAEPGPAWGAGGGVKMERLSPVDSVASCESGGDAVAVAKYKHKLVEQSRREKTRALTSELQAMVPALADFDKGTSINVVLEGVLQYLRDSQKKEDGGGDTGAEAKAAQEQVVSLIRGQIKSVPWGISQKAFAFSPVGMVCSSTSGQLLWFNQTFARMFSQVVSEEASPPSMFSLTAPESLPETMQAATALLLGHRERVAMSKRCTQVDGRNANFNVEMTCIRKHGAPTYFCCYVRATEPAREKLTLTGNETTHPSTNVNKLQELLSGSDVPDELDGLFNFEED